MEVIDMVYDGVKRIEGKIDTEVSHRREKEGEIFNRLGAIETSCAANHSGITPQVTTTFNGKPRTCIKLGKLEISTQSMEVAKYAIAFIALVVSVIAVVYLKTEQAELHDKLNHAISITEQDPEVASNP